MATPAKVVGVGDRMPDVGLSTLDGDVVNPRDFAGKKLVIFVWATW